METVSRYEHMAIALEKTKEVSRAGGVEIVFAADERYEGVSTKEIIDCIAVPIWGKSKADNSFLMMIVHIPYNSGAKTFLTDEMLGQIQEVGYQLMPGGDTKPRFLARLTAEFEELFKDVKKSDAQPKNIKVERTSFGFKKTAVIRFSSEEKSEIDIYEIEN